MKDQIVKNLHWFIIAYVAWGIFGIYEEKMAMLENVKNAIPPIQTKIAQGKKKISEIETFKKNLTQSKERVEEVVKQIEKAQKQLPSDVNDTEVQELLGGIASGIRMKDPSPTPGKENNLGFYFAKEYEFKGVGTFIQHLIFFENLEKADRILNVKNVAMKLDESSIKSRFPIVMLQTLVESFRYNTAYREKSYVQDIEKQFKVE